MPRTLLKSRLQSNKHKPKIKQEVNKTKSNLPAHPQTFKQKSVAGNGFVEYKQEYLHVYEYFILFYIKELRRFSIIR